MWHPFKRVLLEAVTTKEPENTMPDPVINISDEVQKAQLRSLKARTEIGMIYGRLADNALEKLKGTKHAANY